MFFGIAVTSFYLSYRMLDRFQNANLFSVYPLFGEYIKNIIQKGEFYGTCDMVTLCYAGRMPFVPYFMSAIASIYNSIPFAFLVKNTIICFFLVKIFNQLIYNVRLKTITFLGIILVFFIPVNVGTMFDINHEEAYTWILLLLLFTSLIDCLITQETRTNVIVMSVSLVSLILLKSSYLYFVLAISIYLLLILKNKINKLIPLGAVLSTMLLWGLFIYHDTGYFAVMSNMSSLNGINLYKGNNEYIAQYYPQYHIDTLQEEKLYDVYKNIDFSNDEWKQNSYFNEKAKTYIINHPLETLELARRKFMVFFLDINRNTIKKSLLAQIEKTSLIKGKIGDLLYMFFWSINRLVLWSAIWVAFYYTLSKKFNHFDWKKKLSIAYLCTIIFYSLPSLIGFALYRHVIPLIPISILFLVTVLWAKENNTLSSDRRLT
ncbi:hypothetical protein [Aphanothece hegewaldii]|nr:hypothetical protein [Aphanothece hegewaldii]